MSGHVVRPFIVMGIGPRILWCEPRKIGEDVGLHLGRGILLEDQRGRSGATEQGQQPCVHRLGVDPGTDGAGETGQTLVMGVDRPDGGGVVDGG